MNNVGISIIVIENYRKSLELNPENENAKKILNKLQTRNEEGSSS